MEYTKTVADGVAVKKSIGIDAPNELATVRTLTALTEELMDRINALESLTEVPDVDEYGVGMYYKESVIPAMEALRLTADTLEGMVGKDFWPFPTYTELLYHV